MVDALVYESIAVKIIAQQEKIIGPIAVMQAKQVSGVDVNWDIKSVHISIDPREAINNLVQQYSELFGQLSIDICREAVASTLMGLNKEDIPLVLQ